MHALIERLLRKKGIESVETLSTEERQTFDQWQRVLSDGEITVEKIAEFCVMQLRVAEAQFKNLDNSAEKTSRLVILHSIYRAIHELISNPMAEKENLERYLTGLLQ